jgi:hypothetical protein
VELLLYWTGEARKAEAMMVFPYRPDLVDEAGAHFDRVVGQILDKNFRIARPPSGRSARNAIFGPTAPAREPSR